MSELPKCRLCHGKSFKMLAHGTVIHPTDKSRPCALNGIEVTPDQWNLLMGGGEPVASYNLPPLPDLPAKIESYSCDYWEDEQIYEYAQDYAREALRANPHPAPAVGDAVLRKNEKRIASYEWIAEFFRFAPDGGWNNFNNWILNDYFKAGISGQQAARHFYSTEL